MVNITGLLLFLSLHSGEDVAERLIEWNGNDIGLGEVFSRSGSSTLLSNMEKSSSSAFCMMAMSEMGLSPVLAIILALPAYYIFFCSLTYFSS